jgi:molybdopterin-guanine dinucleotide biosynthesis protein A
VQKLYGALIAEDTQLAVAASNEQSHPTIGLWKAGLRDELRKALTADGIRRIDRWTARDPLSTSHWSVEPVDPFFKANTVEDIGAAERLAQLWGI